MLNHQRFWVYLWLFSLFGWIVVALQPVPLIDLPPRGWIGLICLIEGIATAASLFFNWNKHPVIKCFRAQTIP